MLANKAPQNPHAVARFTTIIWTPRNYRRFPAKQSVKVLGNAVTFRVDFGAPGTLPVCGQIGT